MAREKLAAARGTKYINNLHADRGAIETAIADIESVLETFNALLRIGQIEAGARRAAFRPLDLAEVAREVTEAFQLAAEGEGKAIVLGLDAPVSVSGDKELLLQMIANLLDNALLSFADNGPCVAPEELRAIFQCFYRGDAARKAPGPGNGLSLVAAIAELQGLESAASDDRPGLSEEERRAVFVDFIHRPLLVNLNQRRRVRARASGL